MHNSASLVHAEMLRIEQSPALHPHLVQHALDGAAANVGPVHARPNTNAQIHTDTNSMVNRCHCHSMSLRCTTAQSASWLHRLAGAPSDTRVGVVACVCTHADLQHNEIKLDSQAAEATVFTISLKFCWANTARTVFSKPPSYKTNHLECVCVGRQTMCDSRCVHYTLRPPLIGIIVTALVQHRSVMRCAPSRCGAGRARPHLKPLFCHTCVRII